MTEKTEDIKIPLTVRAALGWHIPLLWIVVVWLFVTLSLAVWLIALVAPFFALAVWYFADNSRRNKIKGFTRIYINSVAMFGLLPLFHMSFLTHPGYTAFFLIGAALTGFAPMAGKTRAAAVVLMVLALYTVLSIGQTSQVFWLATFHLALAIAVWWKKSYWIKRGAHLFLLLATLGIMSLLFTEFKSQLDPSLADDILAQKGVTPIFLTHDEDNPITQAVGAQCRFIEQGCDGGLIFGTRGTNSGLAITRKDKVIQTKVLNVSDYIGINCEENSIWAGEFNHGTLFKLDGETGTPLNRIVEVPAPGISRLYWDPEIKSVLTSRDDNNKIIRFDHEKGYVASYHIFDHYVVDFSYSAEMDALFTTTWGGRFFRYQFSKPDLIQEELFTPDWLVQFVSDDENLLIYATKFFAGRVLKINFSTLEITESLKLEPGLRFPMLDKKKGLLFVTNFLTGDCVMIDAETMMVIDFRNFGPRLRRATLSRDGNTLYAASAIGGFAWDISGY